jgi:hypothetical protein
MAPQSLIVGLSIVLLLSSCTEGVERSPGAARSTPAPEPEPSPESNPQRPRFVPPPEKRLPLAAAGVARDLRRLEVALGRSVDAWRQTDPPIGARLPRDVVLQALYQQRIYRALTRDGPLARRVLSRLGGRTARAFRRNVDAGSGLRSLVTPVEPDELFDTQRPEPPQVLLRYYRRAQNHFGVSWEVLAAVNFVETRFGRIRSSSVAGAQGPMQFIPSTWDAYGMGGDVHDPRDAIMGAANYLSASGAPGDYQSALYAYNPAQEYVNAIWAYAREIMDDPRKYYVYYSYQVFMLTTEGDVRITGPGSPT